MNQLEANLRKNVDFLAKNPILNRLLETRVNDLREAVALLVELDEQLLASNASSESLDESYDDLLKSYRVNLIRCDVVQKLVTELDYARSVLAKAVKRQKNLKEARQRVEWLENEIEKNIFANKNVFLTIQNCRLNTIKIQIFIYNYKIQFPLKKSLELDLSLKVEKKSIFEDLNISPFAEYDDEISAKGDESIRKSVRETDTSKASGKDEKISAEPKYQIEQLEFKWDKKSTGSTDSLLESDREVNRKFGIILKTI